MRRRLPAGLRWRLLLALVATSAVTLGAAALVVLPPMQDRLRDQSAEGLETQVAAIQPQFQDVFEELDKKGVSDFEYSTPLGGLAAELNSQSNARVMVLDDDLQMSDTNEQFLYDNEFGETPRRALLLGPAASFATLAAMWLAIASLLEPRLLLAVAMLFARTIALSIATPVAPVLGPLVAALLIAPWLAGRGLRGRLGHGWRGRGGSGRRFE